MRFLFCCRLETTFEEVKNENEAPPVDKEVPVPEDTKTKK